MFRGVKSVDSSSLPDRGCFPGADGSTIQQSGIPNAETVALYGADGSTELTEDGTGYRRVNITTSGVLNGNTSLVYSIKHPLTFIFNTVTPWDWYASNESFQNNTIWCEGGGKSAYDPCPKGWRVPQDGTWHDFTTTNFPFYTAGNQTITKDLFATNGRQYHNFTWYPAAGRRRTTYSGHLSSIGENICSWSTNISGMVSKNLCFYFSSSSPIVAEYRSVGMSVRCVQE